MEQTFTDLLTNLDASLLSNRVPIFVPSCNRAIAFKLLSAKQHKNIISTVVDRALAGVSFAVTMAEILKENCQEPIQILTTDLPYIFTALRSHSLAPEYTTADKVKINLPELLQNQQPTPPDLKKRVITFNDVTATVEIPTIGIDAAANKESLKHNTASDIAETKISLEEIYINEFIKHITNIEFNNNGKPTNIVFSTLSHYQKRQVVEKLPLKLAADIIDYVNNLKTYSRAFLTKEGQPLDISIDQSFFTI